MGKITIVIGIIAPIVVIILVVPLFMNSVSNLQQINQEKENSKPLFVSQFSQVLTDCSKMTGGALANCKQSIPLLKQECSFYDDPPVCSDHRINEILASAP